MHNSAARGDAPKCHPETRKAVQENIFSWVSGNPTNAVPHATEDILWLTGPAGTGKTAIMGTVSDKLEEAGRLAATFYFSSFRRTFTMSKRHLVTTLAYQIAVHPSLKDRLSSSIISAIRENPAVFDLSLKRQLELLILQPLRASQFHLQSTSGPPLSIVIDGVDECGEGQYVNSDRSREDNQIEVLSVLLQAIKDPAFPFRVVVASRPENWIRRFFTDVARGRGHEIFLDDKYNPDNDIRLFLKSKFAEICRRHGINPSIWPMDDVITKLVEDASGQFIYVATILRFINTPPLSPREQLEIVLKIKLPQDTTNPFRMLDALYTSILLLSHSPNDSVIQLKALELFRYPHANISVPYPDSGSLQVSAWTIDRLFEGNSGPVKMLRELPPLVWICAEVATDFDSFEYGNTIKPAPPPTLGAGWNASYTFYHKSFSDYLKDPLRCGVAFPDANKETVHA